jgi:hypothetical protein
MAGTTANSLMARPLTAVALMASAVGEAVARFSISDLFANGEKGANLDKGDSRVTFQDVNGTEPCTEVADPIALTLDQSQGLRPTGDALGPELVTNGTFDDGLTGWNTVSGPSSVTVSDGIVSVTTLAPDNISAIAQEISVVQGQLYWYTATKVSQDDVSAWGFADTPSGLRFENLVQAEPATYSGYFIAPASTIYAQLWSRSDTITDGTTRYANISIRRVVPISERFAGLGDELVTNGDFSSGTTGWAGINDAVLSVAGGVLEVAGNGGFNDAASQSFTTVANTFYVASFEYAGDGTNNGIVQATNNAFALITQTGAISTSTLTPGQLIFKATSTTSRIVIRQNASSAGSAFIANVSIRAIPGNHATQSTDPARPWRGRRPAGGVRNLVERSEDFGHSSWVGSSATGSGNEITFAGTGNAGVTFSLELGDTDGVEAVARVGIKNVSGSANYRIRIQEATGGTVYQVVNSSDAVAPASVQFLEIPITGGNAAGEQFRLVIERRAFGSPADGDKIEATAQLELGDTATPYQRVAAPYDITEEGVASRFYAWDDEVDDDMTIVLPDLGTDATRVTVDRDGNVTYLENQTISGSVSVPLNSQAVIYLDRSPTADEKAGIEGLF